MGKINVIFLDFDGVINTLVYDEKEKRIRYFYPDDGKVNDRTAIEYINLLGEKTEANVVVSSSWRIGETLASLQEILYNSGLRLDVIGKTPRMDYHIRGEEIQEYLKYHPEVDKFIIIDDDEDMGELTHRLVKCEDDIGFKAKQYFEALKLMNYEEKSNI